MLPGFVGVCGVYACMYCLIKLKENSTKQPPPNGCFFCLSYRKDYDNHMLQSRLHFRIHSALQEIKHTRKQVKEASKRDKQLLKRSKKNSNNNTSSSFEDSSTLSRQGSSSSFETAPEYSASDDERDLRDSTTENEWDLGKKLTELTLPNKALSPTNVLRETAV